MMKKLPALLFAAVLLAPTLAVAEGLLDRVAIVAGGQVVTLSQVTDRAALRYGLGDETPADQRLASLRAAASELVDEAVLEAELTRRGVTISEAEVQYAMDEVRKQNGLSAEQFKQAVVMQGYDWETYLIELRVQLRRAKLLNTEVRGKVRISDEDVQAELARRGEVGGGIELRARHILVAVPDGAPPADELAAKQKAEKILERVTGGGELFADVAKEVSDDGTASDGGDLGWFGRGLMVPTFEEAAFGAEPGSVVGPIRTRFGWHIIRVEARREASTRVDAALAERTRRMLYEREVQEQTQRFLERISENVVVRYPVAELAPGGDR